MYSLADLFVLPSRHEGSPNVVLDEVAAGVTIVVSQIGMSPRCLSIMSVGCSFLQRIPKRLPQPSSRCLSVRHWRPDCRIAPRQLSRIVFHRRYSGGDCLRSTLNRCSRRSRECGCHTPYSPCRVSSYSSVGISSS
ncbi:MAG: hypothetical protein LLG20_25315 [Acidobacteriales bacterium]|nr:hypothetical protein [Terriglobales bacterium]